MTPKHTQMLFSVAPRLFREHSLPKTKTSMCWGFQCGDGWFRVLYDVAPRMEAVISSMPLEEQPAAVSVKEKAGTLQFYCETRGADDRAKIVIGKMIEQIERECAVTCEICGESGLLRRCRWLRTLCERCFVKQSW